MTKYLRALTDTIGTLGIVLFIMVVPAMITMLSLLVKIWPALSENERIIVVVASTVAVIGGVLALIGAIKFVREVAGK